MNIAVIPARGGSKRVPRKNVKVFHGLPVISYAIKAAQNCEQIDQVFVSTDDAEIAEIAKSFGADVPWLRPRELSDDFTTTISVIRDAIQRLKADFEDIGNVCCIYPATPLLKPIFLTQSLQILEENNWDFVISANRIESTPERYFHLGALRQIEMQFPLKKDSRTQDLPVTYSDAGQFYWGHSSTWETKTSILSNTSTIFEIPPGSAVDINTLEDWQRAERLFALQKDLQIET
jgi:pseudaminic acid cytidylyltransferase